MTLYSDFSISKNVKYFFKEANNFCKPHQNLPKINRIDCTASTLTLLFDFYVHLFLIYKINPFISYNM